MKRKCMAAAVVIVLSIILPGTSSGRITIDESTALDNIGNSQVIESSGAPTTKANNENVKTNLLAENRNLLDNSKAVSVNCLNQNSDNKCENTNESTAWPRRPHKVAYRNSNGNRTEINEFGIESANHSNNILIEISENVKEDKNDMGNGRRKPMCALGEAEFYLWWLNKDGSLRMKYGVDLSNRQLDDTGILLNFQNVWKNPQVQSYLSLANNMLTNFPIHVIYNIYNNVEYVSLFGNPLDSILTYSNSDVVPELLSLKHLDLRNCNLTFLRTDDLRIIPNVEYLFLSHNKIKTIQSGTFINQRNLKHLDLSYNNWSNNRIKTFLKPAELTIFSDAFATLPLETLDLSFSILNIRNATRSRIRTLFGPNLKHLSLCFTMMSRLRMEMFENAVSLKILDISGNFGVAQSLNRDVFRHLNNSLEVLYVKNNNIRSLTWTSELSKLRFINLKNNLLSSIDGRSFQLMSNLEIIDLSSNLIINWMTPIFEQNPLLKILNIRNNYINSFTNDMLRDFSRVEYLTMGGNPFECTCVLKEVFNTVLPSEEDGVDNELSRFLMDDEDQVTSERLQGSKSVANFLYETYFSKEIMKNKVKVRTKRASKTFLQRFFWRKIRYAVFAGTNLTFKIPDFNDDDYQCMNVTMKERVLISELEMCSRSFEGHISGSSADVEVQLLLVASFISVLGVVLILVVYRRWWYIRYFCIILRNSAILSFCNDDKDDLKKICHDNTGAEYSYDVFVSYSDNDRRWVLDELLPQIEGRDGISVCLHERDFQVGLSILENIINCIDRSKSLLLVISKSFIQSRWCQFEMHMAQHRLLETRRDQLLLVLLEDVDEKQSPRTLRYLMKTKTYIKWSTDVENRELFWKRLKKSLILPDSETNSIKYANNYSK